MQERNKDFEKDPIINFMFKVNNKNTRTTSMTSFWCFYC